MNVIVLVGWLFLRIDTATAIQCLSCAPMPSSIPCVDASQCFTGQECYAKYVLKPNGTVMYEFGCYDSQKCTSEMTIVGKRAIGDIQLCSKCCHGDMCNQRPLCTGPSPSVTSIVYPTTVSRPTDPCSRRPCIWGSYFQLSGGSPSYVRLYPTGYVGTLCDVSTASTTTATTPTTSTTGTTTSANPCSPSPCERGSCFIGSGNSPTFFCLCPSGFTGLHCETVATNPCSPSPCKRGSCFIGSGDSSAFFCLCPSGFEGLYCESVHVPGICKRDVVFVFDQTTSMGEANFRLSTKYAEDILDQMNIGNDMIRTAFVIYHLNIQIAWTLSDASSHQNLTSIKSYLRSLTYYGGESDPDLGLREVYTHITNNSNSHRPGTDLVVILFTDGKSVNPAETLTWAERVKGIASHVFVVAMDMVQGNDLHELTQWATDDAHVIQPHGATTISKDVPRILNLMCQ